MGRRTRKTVWTTSNGIDYANPVVTGYLYDGWNLIAEIDGSGNWIRRYTWGADVRQWLNGSYSTWFNRRHSAA